MHTRRDDPALPERVVTPGRLQRRARARRAGPRAAQGRAAAAHGRRSRDVLARSGGRAARRRARALLDERAGRGRGRRRPAASRCCRPSTRSARSSAATRARPTPRPPSRIDAGARAVPRRRPGRRHVLRRGRSSCAGSALPTTARRSCRAGSTPRSFTPAGPGRDATGRPRLLVLGRLVERKGSGRRDPGAARGARTPSWSWSAARRPTRSTPTRRCARLRAHRRASRRGRPGACFAGAVPRADVPALGPLGRRRRRRALVRAVRHHPAGGDGLRPAGGRPPPSAAWSTPSSTASPATSCRRATRPRSARCSPRCSPTTSAARPTAPPGVRRARARYRLEPRRRRHRSRLPAGRWPTLSWRSPDERRPHPLARSCSPDTCTHLTGADHVASLTAALRR